MRYLMLKMAYDGTNYHGFQRQINALAIQEVVEKALENILKEKINLAASGRTDTGVHALGQVVSFSTNGKIPTNRIVPALKSFLPKDIVVYEAREVNSSFNARFSALDKTYRYKIKTALIESPFERNYAWQLNKELDIKKMQEASTVLLGKHDFSAFRSLGSSPVSPFKTIYVAKWIDKGEGKLEFVINGDGFLYHMVRNLVGCLVKVGQNKISVDNFKEILESKNRAKAGVMAPACGLYLEKVNYN
jgi:tRNA pseudouridine38-40 synthase